MLPQHNINFHSKINGLLLKIYATVSNLMVFIAIFSKEFFHDKNTNFKNINYRSESLVLLDKHES